MNKLQKILNVRSTGSKVGTLSVEETYELVREYTELKSQVKKFAPNQFALNAFFIKSCIIGLQNSIIDPDVFLTAAISYSVNPMFYGAKISPLIAIALRFGANPNLYITYQGKGTFHVMIYTVMFLRDNDVDPETINYILCILALLGSRSNSLVYPKDFIPGQNPKGTKSLGDGKFVPISVNQWLYDNGFFDYNVENLISYIKDNLTEDDQINLGAMCDVVEVAFPRGPASSETGIPKGILKIGDEGAIVSDETEETSGINPWKPGPDLSQVIIYNSYKCIPNITPTFRYVNGEVLELRMCLEGLSFEAFKFLFDKGYKMTYFNLNRLLLLLAGASRASFLSLIYMEILKYAVSKGMRMDLYQFNYFITFASEQSSEIEEIYSNPLWMKACSASSNVPLPETIKELAVSLGILNIEDSRTFGRGTFGASVLKEEVCLKLREISGTFASESFIESNLEKNKLEIKKRIFGAQGALTLGSCANSSSFNENPLNFSEDSLVYVQDSRSEGPKTQGQGTLGDKSLSSRVWCFTPNMFEDLISSGKNPYTNKPLPPKTIAKMATILDFMSSLKIDPKKIVSVSKAVEKLNSPDMITNEHTDKSIAFVESIASIRGIFPQALKSNFEGPRSMSFAGQKIYQAMVAMGFDLDYFRPSGVQEGPKRQSLQEAKLEAKLPSSLMYATFCKALHIFAKRYNDIQRMEQGIPTPEDILMSLF